jgi:hypothetical protein
MTTQTICNERLFILINTFTYAAAILWSLSMHFTLHVSSVTSITSTNLYIDSVLVSLVYSLVIVFVLLSLVYLANIYFIFFKSALLVKGL